MNLNSPKPLILVMTIQIDSERQGQIEVHEGDDLELLARDFCITHNINQRMFPIILENLSQNLKMAKQERENMNDYVNQLLSQKQSQVSEEQKFNNNDVQHLQQPNEGNSVYDRLYQDAHRKKMKKQLQMNEINRVNKRTRTQESDVNYGLILYQKGMKRREQVLSRAENARREQESSQMNECTHQPNLNEVSRVIARKTAEPIGDYLNKVGRLIQERKESAQKEQADMLQQACSFHPEINKVSQYIVDERKKQSQIILPHYEVLYQDKDVKRAKLQQLEQNLNNSLTFHPKIDDISEKIVEGMSFEERQTRFKQKERNQSFDESQLFKPKTGRGPESRPQNIFKSLYNQASIWAQNRANKQSESQERMDNLSRIKASQKSEQISQIQMHKTIIQIFQLLDSDQDGQIDANNIDISQIDIDCLNVLKPILIEMEGWNHVLKQDDFVNIVIRLMNSLSNKEKHQLLKRPKSKTSTPEFTFQPQINSKSQKIVASRRGTHKQE